MLFNSLEFIFVFLPGLLALYYLARRFVSHQLRWWCLRSARSSSIPSGTLRNLPILLGSAVGNYLVGLAIVRWRKKWIVICAIAVNLRALGAFKYLHFFGVWRPSLPAMTSSGQRAIFRSASRSSPSSRSAF